MLGMRPLSNAWQFIVDPRGFYRTIISALLYNVLSDFIIFIYLNDQEEQEEIQMIVTCNTCTALTFFSFHNLHLGLLAPLQILLIRLVRWRGFKGWAQHAAARVAAQIDHSIIHYLVGPDGSPPSHSDLREPFWMRWSLAKKWAADWAKNLRKRCRRNLARSFVDFYGKNLSVKEMFAKARSLRFLSRHYLWRFWRSTVWILVGMHRSTLLFLSDIRSICTRSTDLLQSEKNLSDTSK